MNNKSSPSSRALLASSVSSFAAFAPPSPFPQTGFFASGMTPPPTHASVRAVEATAAEGAAGSSVQLAGEEDIAGGRTAAAGAVAGGAEGSAHGRSGGGEDAGDGKMGAVEVTVGVGAGAEAGARVPHVVPDGNWIEDGSDGEGVEVVGAVRAGTRAAGGGSLLPASDNGGALLAAAGGHAGGISVSIDCSSSDRTLVIAKPPPPIPPSVPPFASSSILTSAPPSPGSRGGC